MTHSFQPIFPPDCLGILGGGQLGRFFVQAAQDLGFTVCVLDPDSQSPAQSPERCAQDSPFSIGQDQ